MNNFLKGSNSKFVVNLFKTFGIACSLVAVQACNENPNNNDKNGEKGGASNGSNNGQKNGEQPSDEDSDEHDADAEEETGSNKNNKNGQTGTNNGSGSGTGENGGNPGSGSGTGSGNGGGSGTGDGTGKGGSNPGGGDATDADAQKKQKITDKITKIDSSTDWNNFTTLVNGIVSDKDLIVDDIFNKIKEKIGGKVYCGSTVLDFTIGDNAKLIDFLKFCDSVENVFKKNDDTLKFYFKAGDNVNIFIDDPNGNNKFKLDNLESFVTIENNNDEGLELDDQGKIKLLSGAEWDSKGDIDKIVGFLEGISKMNLGTDFKCLDVKAENEGKFSIDGFLFNIFEPDSNNNYICKSDVLNKGIGVLDKLGKLKKVINNFFKDLEVAQGDFSSDLSTNTDFKFGNYMLSLKSYFSNNVDACKNFFAALYPDGKYHVKDESGNAGIYRNDSTSEKKVGVLNADFS